MRPLTLPCLFLCTLVFFFQSVLHAQPVCGFDHLHNKLLNTSSEFKKQVQLSDQQISTWLNAKKAANNIITDGRVINGSETIYEVPVVLHVMHLGDAAGTKYNPSDAQLTGMIDYLNQAFQATWAAYSNPSNGGTSVPFRFVLAQRAPDCTPTTGILRVDASGVTDYASFGIRSQSVTGAIETDLKALSVWPANQYYNIWIVNRIDGKDGYPGTVGSFVAGYAYYPNAPSNVDGTIMLASQALAGQKTLPHEIGHAFGLLHTFQGASGSTCAANTNCNTDGDLVCDTDPTNEDAFFLCPASTDINPCTGTPWNGQQYNFMHYTACADKRFTPGQRDRMIAAVNTVRVGLLTSAGLRPPDMQASSAVCGPTYITFSNNGNDMGPVRIQFNTLDDSSFSYSRDYHYYEDNTCNMGTTVMAGQTYSLRLSTRSNRQIAKAWIDFNDNGLFEASEKVLESLTPSSGLTSNRYTHTADVAIPAGAVQNKPLRLRVLADWMTNTAIQPCDGLMYGQTEDYSLTVVPAGTLPVRLFDERISLRNNFVLVSFKSSEEKDVVRYELQRAGDSNKNFSGIKALSPAHSLSSTNEYMFTDDLPDEDANWYRIMAVQQDGSRYYSRILGKPAATVLRNDPPQVYPNPTKGDIHVAVSLPPGVAVQLELTDTQGRRVYTGTRSSDQPITINGNFPAGMYYLSITAGQSKWNSKIVVTGR